jgi:hypothetical protein
MDRNPHSLNKMFGVLCIIPVIAHLTFMFDTWSPPLLWVDDPKWPYYIYIYYVCMYVLHMFERFLITQLPGSPC